MKRVAYLIWLRILKKMKKFEYYILIGGILLVLFWDKIRLIFKKNDLRSEGGGGVGGGGGGGGGSQVNRFIPLITNSDVLIFKSNEGIKLSDGEKLTVSKGNSFEITFLDALNKKNKQNNKKEDWATVKVKGNMANNDAFQLTVNLEVSYNLGISSDRYKIHLIRLAYQDANKIRYFIRKIEKDNGALTPEEKSVIYSI